MPDTSSKKVKPKVTVLVPARNEAGNIQNIFDRVPEMGWWNRVALC